MINNLSLRDFLFTCEGTFSFLNTNNETFPEKYRRNLIHYAELYRILIKNDQNELLERNIKSISLVPYIKPNDSTQVIFYPSSGFVLRTDNQESTIVAPAISISLE